MSLKRVTLTIAILGLSSLGLSMPAMAGPSINDMQGCQALLDFVDQKLDPANAKYSDANVKTVRTGLKIYNDYIQSTIVTPGLLEFNGGDKAKADAMQKQVDAYKKTVTASYHQKYSKDRLFTDHAVGVNGCAQKAVPSGADLEALKAAVLTMMDMAKQN